MRAKAPLTFGLLAILAAALLFLWEPWRGEAPDGASREQTSSATDAGTLRSAEVAADDTETAQTEVGESDPSVSAPREEVAAETTLRGAFRAPTGFWPGGGSAELHPARPVPEGGFMGAIGEMMSQARKGDTKNVTFRSTGQAEVDFQKMFQPTVALLHEPLDAHGAFTLQDPPPGAYEIVLNHPRIRNAHRVEIEVVMGDHTDLGVIDTVPASSLLVLVSDEEGQPVTNAWLALGKEIDFSRFSDPSFLEDMPDMMRQFVPRSGNTDERGACRFDGLDQERWTLGVKSRELVDDLRPVFTPAGRETLVRVELSGGASLRARVLDPDGKPMDDASLRVRFPDGPKRAQFGSVVESSHTEGKTLHTGEDGVATANGLLPGRSLVRLRTAGFLEEEREIVLTPGRTSEVEFRLDVGGSVSGHVLDEDGAPVPDAWVMHMAMLGQEFMGMDMGTFVGVDMLSLGIKRSGVPADHDGHFTLGGFEPDQKAYLIAAAKDFDPARIDDVDVGSTDVEFRLLRSTTLTGTVRTDDGESIPDFEVRLEQRMWLVVDRPVVLERFEGVADGAFTIDTVPRDRFKAVISSPGRAAWHKSVDLSKGSVDLGEIELGLPAAIEGIVVDPDNNPVEDAAVRVAKGGVVDSLVMSKLFGSKIVKTDAEGRFRLEGLSGRRVRLLADKSGFAPLKSKTVAIAMGEATTGVLLRLTRGGSVRGRVVDGDGTPQPDWNIQLSLASGRSIQNARSGEDGEFHLDGLASGTHKIEAYPGDYMKKFGGDISGFDDDTNFDFGKMMDAALKWSIRDQVVVQEGEESEIELVFEPPDDDSAEGLVTVEGRVRVGGRMLESGMVTLFRAGSSAPVRIQHVRDGSFEMKGLRPGAYRAQVQTGLLSAVVGRPQHVQIPDASVHRLDIDLPGGLLEGVVVYTEDGRPGSGVVLTLASADDGGAGFDRADIGEGSLLTDASGAFRFDGLGPGSYEVFAKELIGTGSGDSGRLTDLTLAAGEQRTGLELFMRGGGTLRIAVRDSRGPRANAIVTLLKPDGKPIDLFHRALTDPDGVATLTGLPEGSYRATVDAPRAAAAVSEVVEIHPGITRDLDVSLRSGCEITVRVTGEVPERATGALVSYSVWQPDGALLRAGRIMVPSKTATGAELRLGSYAPGRYMVRLEASAGVLEREHDVPDQPSMTISVDAGALLK